MGGFTYTKSYMNKNDDDGAKTAKTVTLKTHTWVDDEEGSAKTVVPASHMARHTRIDDEEKKNGKLSHIIPERGKLSHPGEQILIGLAV